MRIQYSNEFLQYTINFSFSAFQRECERVKNSFSIFFHNPRAEYCSRALKSKVYPFTKWMRDFGENPWKKKCESFGVELLKTFGIFPMIYLTSIAVECESFSFSALFSVAHFIRKVFLVATEKAPHKTNKWRDLAGIDFNFSSMNLPDFTASKTLLVQKLNENFSWNYVWILVISSSKMAAKLRTQHN